MNNENSVDTPADALRDGLLASGATLDGMLTDLRERREADGAADRCRLKIVINKTAMSATFPSRADAMLAAIDWVQDEAETRFSGNLDECYAAARRWVEGQSGTMEIAE